MPISSISEIDIIEGVFARETGGRVTELHRLGRFRVTPGDGTFNEDQVVFEMLQDVGTFPIPGAPHPHDAALVLTDREVRALDTNTLTCLYVYKRPDSGGFPPPPANSFVISGSAGVEQIETALDRQLNQITVADAGGLVQGGRITPLEARSEISLRQNALSSDPFSFSETWTNTVNTGSFFYDTNATARTWLFARVGFTLIEPFSLPFPTWEFNFELRKNPDKWDPQVIFRDPETGEPPDGLVAGVGYKTIQWHSALNFATLFG